jgi:predicted anti-sigma-YlaC factor YlaD
VRTAEVQGACAAARAWASAHGDGEATADPVQAAHLAGCAACRSWVAVAADLDRRLALRPASPPPDVPDLVAAAVATWDRTPAPDRSTQALVGRGLLGVAAATGLVLSGLQLLAPTTSAARFAGHVAVDLLVFEVVTALAFLAAARHPRRYVAVLLGPVVALVVLSTLAGAAATATGTGAPHLLAEAGHLPLLVGLAGLLLIADARELLPGSRRPLP